MKNTIEKALQKQQAIDAEKEQNVSQDSDANADISNIDTAENESVSSQTASTDNRANSSKTETELVNTKTTSDKFFDIDMAHLEKEGFVSLENSRNLISEEYREIKRKLLNNAFGPLVSTITNSNIIMVSSARPSEGKTFTATNLAISIAAEQDKTVLLVDADVLKPNVLRTLGLENKNGLMEYLLGKVEDLSEVIYHTNIPKLRIIPAGQSHHLSTELLASSVMKDTIEEFATRYPDRVVIIDTPPLIGINESAILANLAGQAVVVVEEGRSKMHDIQKAVERLNPDMAIGFVVNKSTKFSEKGGYYGYQYYGHDKDD